MEMRKDQIPLGELADPQAHGRTARNATGKAGPRTASPSTAWKQQRVPAPKGPQRRGHLNVPPCSPHLLQAFAPMSPAH